MKHLLDKIQIIVKKGKRKHLNYQITWLFR